MSSLQSQLASDLAGIFSAEAGQSATYTDLSGTETACTVVLSEDDQADRTAGDAGLANARTATCLMDADEIDLPVPGATLQDGSQEWTLLNVRPIAGGAYFRCRLQRSEPTERTRRDYRSLR